MGFFDEFKLVKKKSGVVVKYKTATLMTINPKTFQDLIYDHLSKKMIEEISSRITPSSTSRKTNSLAIKLLAAYNSMRKEYYKNPRLKNFVVKSKEYKYFVQASEFLSTHNVTPESFLNAQVEGLSFVNNGAGTFPKPNQLATLEAEERLMKSTFAESTKKDIANVKRLELNRSDRDTPLMENSRFVSRYNKVKNKTANLQDTYFVYDCMLERKGNVTSTVNDYLEGLLNDD